MAIFGGDPLLSLLSAEDRAALVELGNERHYAVGQRILGQGDIDHFVGLILRGWTVVRAEAQNGRSIIFGLCGPMDVIGEMAALDGGPRSATVTALLDVRARIIPAADFLSFLNNRPDARDAMARSLSARLRAADDQSRTLATLTVLQRLARLLLDLDADPDADLEPDPGRAPAAAAPGARLTQQEFAAAIGTTRESVAKALADLRARGVLRSEGRRIAVLDKGALQAIALL